MACLWAHWRSSSGFRRKIKEDEIRGAAGAVAVPVLFVSELQRPRGRVDGLALELCPPSGLALATIELPANLTNELAQHAVTSGCARA